MVPVVLQTQAWAKQPDATEDDAVESLKQIVYRYNRDPTTDEVEVDLIGDASIAQQGDLITRQGIEWKVTRVIVEESVALTIYRVFLANQ